MSGAASKTSPRTRTCRDLSYRRQGLEFRQVRRQMSPRLGRPHIEGRHHLEIAGIIQTRRLQRPYRAGAGFSEQGRAAIGAEVAGGDVSGISLGCEGFGCPLQKTEGLSRHDDHRRVTAAGGVLAVPAVAFDHGQRCGGHLITDSAASAATLERYGHRFSRFCRYLPPIWALPGWRICAGRPHARPDRGKTYVEMCI